MECVCLPRALAGEMVQALVDPSTLEMACTWLQMDPAA
jgi:hypothetical protein